MSHDNHDGSFEDFRGEKPIYDPSCKHCIRLKEIAEAEKESKRRDMRDLRPRSR